MTFLSVVKTIIQMSLSFNAKKYNSIALQFTAFIFLLIINLLVGAKLSDVFIIIPWSHRKRNQRPYISHPLLQYKDKFHEDPNLEKAIIVHQSAWCKSNIHWRVDVLWGYNWVYWATVLQHIITCSFLGTSYVFFTYDCEVKKI